MCIESLNNETDSSQPDDGAIYHNNFVGGKKTCIVNSLTDTLYQKL